jgi:hypothetical protein
MAYNTKSIKKDFSENPIPQGFEPVLDVYQPQTVTTLPNGRNAIDTYKYGGPIKVVMEDKEVIVPAGGVVRIDPPTDTLYAKEGYTYLTIGIQEKTNTSHDFELQRQPLGLVRTSFSLANTFAQFINKYGGWEQIKFVTPRERIYIKNLSTTDKTYLCSVYLNVD